MSTNGRFFAYDPVDGASFFGDEAAARKQAQDWLDEERDKSGDGWSEDVSGICWGEVLGEVVQTKNEPAPEGSEFDYIADYALRGVAARRPSPAVEVRPPRPVEPQNRQVREGDQPKATKAADEVRGVVTINVRKRADDWHAQIGDDATRWDCGPSPASAIGSLVRSHGDALAVSIRLVPDAGAGTEGE